MAFYVSFFAEKKKKDKKTEDAVSGTGFLKCRREISSRISVMHISSAKKVLLSKRAILYLQTGNIAFIKYVCKKAPEKNKKIQKNLFKDRKKDILKVREKIVH